ncbi:J domain-containing protein [Phragmitibacter flavus]|nr:DnaJ domain-containing protein [Phragmitibacter flavus]
MAGDSNEMMDGFQMLGLKRSASMDEEVLQQAYAKLSREEHPDHGGSDATAAAVNQAFETLRVPELRLKHLLELAGPEEVKAWRTVPLDDGMMTIFGRLGAMLQKASAMAVKLEGARSALVKALLADGVLKLRDELEQLGMEIAGKKEEMEAQLADLDGRLETGEQEAWKELASLQARFAYLGRWRGQIRESLLLLTVD